MKKTFKLLILLSALLSATVGKAQEVLHEEVDNPDDDRYGPNEFVFNHPSWRIGGGFPLLSGESKEFTSIWETTAASRTKLRISGLLSVGFDISFTGTFIKIDGDKYSSFNNYFGDSMVPEESESLNNYSVGAGAFIRVNFDPKRGNYLGYYLDIGIEPSFAVVEKYTQNTEVGKIKKKIRYTPLPFANNFQYSAFARLAYNMIAIGAEYRLSDHYPKANIPEPPRVLFFIEFNTYSL